ncbi:MAG: hypothetical protein ABFC34_10840 [Methanobacterium sp.]
MNKYSDFKKWYEISNLKSDGHLFEMIIAEMSQETGFLSVIWIFYCLNTAK